MVLSRTALIACLALLAGVLAACSQSSTLPHSSPDAQPFASAGDSLVLLPVRMKARQPVEPAFKAMRMIQPLAALSAVPAPHAISAEESFAVLAGGQFSVGLENAVIALADIGQFTADWQAAAPDAADGLSYAFYDFTIPVGFTGDPTCSLAWVAENAPLTASDAWIGLSDWAAGAWDWYPYEQDGTITFADLPTYARSTDGRLLVVVALTGQQTCLLDRVSIGAPELRATGSDEDTVEAPPATPPFYVPKGASEVLPSAVDLSAGCAPVNDQGTWGSCTCFATGDGALNFELNRLYADLEWDLNNDFNRVSPKHLYIESGKQQDFPPDPSYGRWTDQVIAGLIDFGVATAQNAPYDLVYDDDWSAAALADAEQLKIANWLPIPCNGSAGLQNVKAVLAYYEQPLVMRINLDYWFAYYEPGAVWDYTGPSYGGHAMLIVGYDDSKQAFKVRNSWSNDWGDAGYVWIGYATFSNGWAYVRAWTLNCDYSAGVAQRFTDQQSALPPPTGLTAADGDDAETIVLSWTKAAPATGYRVYRDSHTTLVAELGDVATWTDQSIHDSYSHMYWITAIDATSESVFGAPDLGYLAQPPVIQYITPDSGREGREAIFIGALSGSGPITYSWDFGGAATIETSAEAVPVVTLGEIGEYTVSLEVTSSWGTDNLDISFTVYPGTPPLPELRAPSVSGRTPLTVDFDASGSYDPDGAIAQYEWDFNYDGIYDQTTTQPQVSHIYTEVGGTCCILRVTDNSGLTATVGLNVGVLSTENILPSLYWPGDTLGPPPVTKLYSGSGASDQDGEIVLWEYDLDGDGLYELSGTLIEVSQTYTDDATLIVKCRVTDNEGGIAEQQATVTIGTGGDPPGWESHALEDFISANSILARATLAAGKPVVLALEDDQDNLYSYFSTVAQPDSNDDWIRYTVEDSVFVNNTLAACAVGTAAVVAYKAGNGLTYGRFNGANWEKHVVTAADTGRMEVAEINGVPCIAFQEGVQLRYARATTATPVSAADWQVMDVGTGTDAGGGVSLAALGNLPLIAFGQRDSSSPKLAFARATTVDPSLPGDWTWHFIEANTDTADYPSIAVIDGTPAVAYAERVGENGLCLARASSSTPSASGDWTIYTIENQTTVTDAKLRFLSGLPAIGYIGGGGWPAVSLAESTTADPTGSGDWTLGRHADRATFHDLLNVLDSPALIYTDIDTDTLYYYYRAP